MIRPSIENGNKITGISEAQREMFVREQMRVIQQELGEGDIFEDDIQELESRLQDANLPDETHKQAMKELQRLKLMSPIAPESSMIRTYLEWLLDVTVVVHAV